MNNKLSYVLVILVCILFCFSLTQYYINNIKNMPKKKFTNIHYMSNDGMVTRIWGPPLWFYLHTMSFNFPVNPTSKQKKEYYNFIKSLEGVLPCGACRKNLKKNLKKANFGMNVFKTRDTFSRFIYNLHNIINEMLHKPKPYPKFEEIRDRYEILRASCSKNTNGKEDGCEDSIRTKKEYKCYIDIISNKCKRHGVKFPK